MIDGREVAPFAASRDMYLDESNKPTGKSITGPLAAGIPGTPAAIVHLAKNYGHLPLELVLGPAIKLAREGFTTSELYTARSKAVLQRLQSFPQTAEIFLEQNFAPKPGFLLRQKELANVLEKLAWKGLMVL